MSLEKNVNEVLHRIQVKLHPNYLPNAEGVYIARTDGEAVLNIEQVCEDLKNRGSFTGDYEELVDNVKKYFDEAMCQLCNGYTVDTGYFTIHPSIGGTFISDADAHNPKKNPVSFNFRTLAPLRELASHIIVEIVGSKNGNAFIDEFVDNYEKSINSLYVPGDIFSLYGNKIKVAGDNPECGVFFVPIDDPSKAVKVHRIVENLPSKIIGEAPDTKFQYNRIEIRTQFSGSATSFLEHPHVITSSFVLEAA